MSGAPSVDDHLPRGAAEAAPASYGESFADVYDRWYGEGSEVDAGTGPAVAQLADWAGEGPALELGVGTGRLAIPLAAIGIPTVGVDASASMLGRLRRKPGGDEVATVVGDMAALPVRPAGDFSLVFIAYSTLFNLPSAEAQQRCLDAAAAALTPGGHLAVEGFVPSPEPDRVARVVAPSPVAPGVVTDSSRDPATQTLRGSHLHFGPHGVRVRRWLLHYARPDQIDAMAAGAGLRLVGRWEGWRGEPFGDGSARHVSLYGSA